MLQSLHDGRTRSITQAQTLSLSAVQCLCGLEAKERVRPWVNRLSWECMLILLALIVGGSLYAQSLADFIEPPVPTQPNPPRDWRLISPAEQVAQGEGQQTQQTTVVAASAGGSTDDLLRYRLDQPVPYLSIVTACDSGDFSHLENLIGSIHHHAPNHRILVYDLGLDPEHVAVLHTLLNVRLVPLAEWFHPRSDQGKPAHLLDMRYQAFQPIIMQDALTTNRHGGSPGESPILYIDVTLQLSSYPHLVESHLRAFGYLFVAPDNSSALLHHTNRAMVDAMPKVAAAWDQLKSQSMVYSGLQAYRADSPAVEAVLLPAVACALDLACLAPTAADAASASVSDSPVESPDVVRGSISSAFSLLVHLAHLRVEHDVAFWGTPENTIEMSHLALKNQTFFRPTYSSSATLVPGEHGGRSPAPSLLLDGMKRRTYIDSVIKHTTLAIVLPFINQDLPRLQMQWALSLDYPPCRLPTANPIDLIFYNSAFPNQTLEDQLLAMIDAPESAQVRACYRRVYIQYARLEAKEDLYPSGPSYMFQRLMSHPTIGLRQYGYTHFFLQEADVFPVREFWLDALFNVALDRAPESSELLPARHYSACNWWMQGTIYRGQVSIGDWMLHINGNAVYHLSSEFVEYSQKVWTAFPIAKRAYDGALLQYMSGNPSYPKQSTRGSPRQKEMGLYWHKFRFTDMIRNCWHASCGPHSQFLLENPSAFLVHTSLNVEHPARGQPPHRWWVWAACLLPIAAAVLLAVWWAVKRGRCRCWRFTRPRATSDDVRD